MSLLNKERSFTISKVLPNFIKENIESTQSVWKREILEKLPVALKGNDPRAIRFWLGLLDLYNSSEIFTLEKEEVERILMVLYEFIISTKFLQFSTSAIEIFEDIIDSIYEPLDIEFEWRKIYDVLYKFGLSHSKIKRMKMPDNYISSMITFTVSCKRYFKIDTTEEVLEEWKALIDPQKPLCNVGTSLMCLFLPVNHNKHKLWFDYVMSIWNLFVSVMADCIFMPLFVRLSGQYLPDLDWSPYVPMFFQKLGIFIGVPVSPIDQEQDSRAIFPSESSDFIFAEPMTSSNLTFHFATLIVRLLSTSAKDTVKEYLGRLIHLLAPLHSPLPQTDNGNTLAQAIIFLDSLVASYAQRVKADRRNKLKLPPLTEDDHIWFLNLILPLYLLELYHAESSCEQLGQLVQMIPSVAIPPVYDAFVRLSEYTHLKEPALRTMAAIAPTIFTTKIMESEFLNVVFSFADDITAMDIQKSLWIFTLYEATMWCIKVDNLMSDWACNLISKCIEFSTTAVSEDFNGCLASMELMLSAFSMSITSNVRKQVENLIEEAIPSLPTCNLSRFIDSIIPESFSKFCFKEINEKNLIIIKCLVRSSKDFGLKYDFDKVIFEGLKSPLKKVRHQACAIVKWLLKFYTLVFPFIPQRQGVSKITNESIEWHIPSDDEYAKSCAIIDKCFVVIKEMFEKEDKQSKMTAIKLTHSVLKGMIGAVSPLDFETKQCEPMFIAPTVSPRSSPEISKRLTQIAEWLLSIVSDDLHENVIALIIKCFTVVISPFDPIANRSETISNQFDFFCGATKQSVLIPSIDAMFPNHHYWLALKLYSTWIQLIDIPINELIKKVVIKMFMFAANPLPEVRMKIDIFMAQAALFYGIELAEIFPRLMDIFNDCFLLNVDQLSTISIFMSDFIQVANPATQFKYIGQIAINLCRQLPLDVPNDSLRALRNDIVRVIDNLDFSTPPLDTEEIYEERRKIVYSSIQRSDLFSSSSETQNYAVALVCSCLMGKKPVLEPDVFEFISSMFLSDDASVRSVSLQMLGSALEMLIPRVPKDSIDDSHKIEYETINSSNFDNFKFKDNKVREKKNKKSRVLTKEEAFDENVVKQFFPDDYENRVDIHKTLYQIFFENNSNFILQFCKLFVNSQTHNNESFILDHYSFWVSAIRFFGTSLSLKILEISWEYLSEEPQVAHLFTASEMVAAVISSTVYFKYADIEILLEPLFKFLKEALCGRECDTSFSWLIVLFSVLGDLDPRRFFWLFDFLSNLHPNKDNQSASKHFRQDTEICMLLIFYANRSPELMKNVIESRFPSYFNVEQFDISRSAVIQVLLSVSRSCCRFPFSQEWEQIMRYIFDEYIYKTDHKFFSKWVYEQFMQYSFGSISAAPLCVEKLREIVTLDIQNDDDSTLLLNNGVVGIIRTNLFIKDSSKEAKEEKINELIDKLNPNNLPWPKQVVMLSLLVELTKEMFFYIPDKSLDFIIDNIALPLLEHPNGEVADTASVLFSFILRSFVKKRENISDYVEKFTRMLNTSDKRLAGAKGLFSIIWSTLIFDDVPQYIVDAFEALTSNDWNDSVLEDAVNQFLGDFWNVHDGNFTENAIRSLSQFRSNLMPSYFS